MAEGNQSPPKAEVDDSPLQHAMDRNKECEYAFALPFLSIPFFFSFPIGREDLYYLLQDVILYTLNFSIFNGQGCNGSPRCCVVDRKDERKQ